ncbi:MAG TPA: hypothetical protein DDW18_04210 [Firmicutes bacterium]|nr:hypothetical protein [Bacillota bacterium]HBN00603.1 hypothetical protein [Bacillota bacterium]
MDFQQLEGKEYIWKKAKCSSTENGTIVSVNLDGRYLVGKGEDEKQHFFSFDSFKEEGSLLLKDENLLAEIRSVLFLEEKKAKEELLALRKKRDEERFVEEAFALARKNAKKKTSHSKKK